MSFSFPQAGLGQKIGAWLSAWQYVLWLLLALAISAGLNVWQWKRAITAPLRAEVAAKGQALEDSEKINEAMRIQARELLAAGDVVAGTMQQAEKDYQSAVRKAPLTTLNCSPGTGRMEATNRALGAPAK